MDSSLSDLRLHLWAPDPDPLIGMKRRYSLCGMSVGRFTAHLEDVDCAECLAELKRKEKHESVAPVGE